MTKQEAQDVVNELRIGKVYPNVDIEPLHGVGTHDFPTGKMVTKECIVNFLNYQCMMLNGAIDQQELSNCLASLKLKKVVVV